MWKCKIIGELVSFHKNHDSQVIHDYQTHKKLHTAGCQWLTSDILATQEAEIRRIAFQSQSRKIVSSSYSEKPFTKIRLVEWIKVKALSSSPSTTKIKKKLHTNQSIYQKNLE
jgi:hypothetical protein